MEVAQNQVKIMKRYWQLVTGPRRNGIEFGFGDAIRFGETTIEKWFDHSSKPIDKWACHRTPRNRHTLQPTESLYPLTEITLHTSRAGPRVPSPATSDTSPRSAPVRRASNTTRRTRRRHRSARSWPTA